MSRAASTEANHGAHSWVELRLAEYARQLLVQAALGCSHQKALLNLRIQGACRLPAAETMQFAPPASSGSADLI